MKKLLVLSLALVIGCFLLVSCGGNTPTEGETENAATEANEEVTLVGQWEYTGGGYVYTFNEDGTGTYDTGAAKLEFTYTYTDTVLSITYTGNTVPTELEYSIDGTVLNVKDSSGNDTLYNRK